MPITTKHPKYEKQVDDWRTTRDVIEGEKAIRRDILRYLPPPPGLALQGQVNLNEILDGGWQRGQHNRYTFYASFAEFPDITNQALNAIQGLVHEKPPTLVLPPDMEYLRETATPTGDTMEELWEAITRELFVTGRYGLLTEIFADDLFLCPYVAESIINWHVRPKLLGGGLLLAVLKETSREPKPDDRFVLQEVTRYRELEIDPSRDTPVYRVRLWQAKEGEDPTVAEVEGADDDGWLTPSLFGRSWDEIPLTVINAIEKGMTFGPIPVLPMARRALAIFRRSADYNRALYVKGDPQPVLFGVDEEDAPSEIGGGTVWAFPNENGKAEYLDIDGQGIPMMRQSIMDQYDRFTQETGQLADDSSPGGPESGEAIRRRQAAAQVSVKSIVVNAGTAVQHHLRQMAMLKGKSEAEAEQIIFAPNTDFSEPLMSGKALMEYVSAKNQGAVISHRTIHELARRHKVTELSYEDEVALIEEEEFDNPAPNPPPDGDDGEGDRQPNDNEGPEGTDDGED